MSNSCCEAPCEKVTTNCAVHLERTNYVQFDPVVCNIREIYKKYEYMARNVKRSSTGTSSKSLAKLFEDYDLVAAGYSASSACLKKTEVKFYDINQIRSLFTEQFVVDNSSNASNPELKVICENSPFKLCQPKLLPCDAKYRLVLVFFYRYEECDRDLDSDKPFKLDFYAVDVPSVNCKTDIKLNLQLVLSVDTDMIAQERNVPTNYRCVNPNQTGTRNSPSKPWGKVKQYINDSTENGNSEEDVEEDEEHRINRIVRENIFKYLN